MIPKDKCRLARMTPPGNWLAAVLPHGMGDSRAPAHPAQPRAEARDGHGQTPRCSYPRRVLAVHPRCPCTPPAFGRRAGGRTPHGFAARACAHPAWAPCSLLQRATVGKGRQELAGALCSRGSSSALLRGCKTFVVELYLCPRSCTSLQGFSQGDAPWAPVRGHLGETLLGSFPNSGKLRDHGSSWGPGGSQPS